MSPIRRFLTNRYPGAQIQLEGRAERSPINMLLDLVELQFEQKSGRSHRVGLVWVQGGGASADYYKIDRTVHLVQGDLDLRLRSMMRAYLTRPTVDDAPFWNPFSISARAAAEALRYGDPQRLITLLTNPYVDPSPTPVIETMERMPINVAYLSQWALAIAHEAGHYYADHVMDQDIFHESSDIMTLLLEHSAEAQLERPDTERLLHETTADAFAVETFWGFVSLVAEWLGVSRSPSEELDDQRQTIFEFVLYFRVLNWLHEVGVAIRGGDPARARHSRRELHVRELMTLDQFAFNRVLASDTELSAAGIRQQWTTDISDLRRDRDFVEGAVAVSLLLRPGPTCDTATTRSRIEEFLLDTAPPTSAQFSDLIEACAANPRYYQPTPADTWWLTEPSPPPPS